MEIKVTQSSDHEVLRWRPGVGHLAFLCTDSLRPYCQVSERERDIGTFSLIWSTNINISRIVNAVPVTLYSRVPINVEIVVLNCQKCNQCLKGHKYLLKF